MSMCEKLARHRRYERQDPRRPVFHLAWAQARAPRYRDYHHRRRQRNCIPPFPLSLLIRLWSLRTTVSITNTHERHDLRRGTQLQHRCGRVQHPPPHHRASPRRDSQCRQPGGWTTYHSADIHQAESFNSQEELGMKLATCMCVGTRVSLLPPPVSAASSNRRRSRSSFPRRSRHLAWAWAWQAFLTEPLHARRHRTSGAAGSTTSSTATPAA